MPSPEEMERAYLERREQLALEWQSYAREHGTAMAIRMNADPVVVRGPLFESFVIGKLAELQVLAQEQTIVRQEVAQ